MYEIERRFLVPTLPTELPAPKRIEQYYLANLQGLAVRIRFVDEALHSITFKKNVRSGINFEMEYPLSDEGKEGLLPVLRSIAIAGDLPHIRKMRYAIPHNELLIELDVISRDGKYVVIAEIEVPTIDHELRELPPWIGEEITGQRVWSNASIAKFGFPL